MTDARPAPLWLRALGASVLVLMALALAYTVSVAVQRFSQIGV